MSYSSSTFSFNDSQDDDTHVASIYNRFSSNVFIHRLLDKYESAKNHHLHFAADARQQNFICTNAASQLVDNDMAALQYSVWK